MELSTYVPSTDQTPYSNEFFTFGQLLNTSSQVVIGGTICWIQSLQAAHNLNSAIIDMEPTGHYWLSVSRWLSEKQFEVILVNPHLVKKNKENRDNSPSKSDKKDALVIVDMVKNGYYSFIRNTPEAFEELRVFLSTRDSVVTRLVSAKNQIHRWVDVVFPELRQVFKGLPYQI